MTPAAYVEAAAGRAGPPRARGPGAAGRRGRRAPAASAPPRRCAARSTAAWASRPPTTATASSTTTRRTTMQIAILLFDRFTALDAVGPYEVLSRLPGARRDLRGPEAGPVAHRHRHARASRPTRRSTTCRSPTSSWCPAASARGALLQDEATPRLGARPPTRPARGRRRSAPASLVLGAAGLLDGLEATTYWLARDELRSYGATPVERARGRATARSSPPPACRPGIDMALTLVARDRRRRPGAGDPARHRVRPAAAVRRRLAVEGAGRDQGARPRTAGATEQVVSG